jgi:O-antigen biosynthesis protein
MILLNKEIEPLFWTPSRLDKDSSWWGHVPFAHWMVSNCKPRSLVELGTEKGVSYAAFCDAIAKSYIFKAKLFAVDTWKGDNHTGSYDDSVYQELYEFNDAHYSSFSKLLRMTFDDALDVFFDHTIDILHIDGYHTYNAISHDFNSWRIKLSDRAVVLIHDTNIRNKEDFGVWKFFEELTQKFPTFNFLHSYGLGIVAIGSDPPQSIIDLCSLSDSDIEKIRNIFAHLGAIWVGVNRSYRSLDLLNGGSIR